MKWEYLITYLSYGEERDLSGLGKLEWELVAIILPDGELPKAYFKRPLRTKSEDEIMKHFDKPHDEDRSSLV